MNTELPTNTNTNIEKNIIRSVHHVCEHVVGAAYRQFGRDEVRAVAQDIVDDEDADQAVRLTAYEYLTGGGECDCQVASSPHGDTEPRCHSCGKRVPEHQQFERLFGGRVVTLCTPCAEQEDEDESSSYLLLTELPTSKLSTFTPRGSRVEGGGLFVGRRSGLNGHVYVSWGEGAEYTPRHIERFEALCRVFDRKPAPKCTCQGAESCPICRKAMDDLGIGFLHQM